MGGFMVLTLEVGQMVKKGAMRKFKEFFPTMFKMIGGCSPEMIPEHLGMILAKLPEEKRVELVKKMVSVLMEQQKLDTQGQKFNEFYQRQEERFKPMPALLKEVANSVEKEFLKIEMFKDHSTVRVGKIENKKNFEESIVWKVQPNYGFSLFHKEDGTRYYEEPGFQVKETIWLIDGIREKTLTFETEQETVEYLIKKISKEVAQS
ncbi:MAG: hypothetical protein IH886_15780 [Nitrospinae bacterium]|nr:hypothetical protein [Nitrospinota bacterium]